ncbi:hypothetical protein [Arthrobacter cavernae]|uniref:Uncharacterized protein n=1 Tax=Arthrobacter cavernae TaxID=2817681 RepID=A0A939HFF6_9MICC|nr:hypothetical protein [Arthrobacter cavernae]MBO1269889.1 hypothetical protein [Arthrobacter cavernae]
MYEMKRMGRDSAELTALSDHLTAHGIAPEMPAGPLPDMSSKRNATNHGAS